MVFNHGIPHPQSHNYLPPDLWVRFVDDDELLLAARLSSYWWDRGYNFTPFECYIQIHNLRRKDGHEYIPFEEIKTTA